MTVKQSMLIASAALFMLACSQPPSAPSPAAVASVKVAYDPGTIKKGDKGHCVVCALKEGKKEAEAVAETLDYQGKTYVFCNEAEKAEFISDPAKYATQ